MPQLPGWKRAWAAWTDATQSLGEQGRLATSDVPARATAVAEWARSHVTAVPGELAGRLRRSMNMLELATKHDVEAQGKLGRNRVAYVLKEFLESQRGRDEALRNSLRAEVREELERLAAARDDDPLGDRLAAPRARRPRTRSTADDDFDDFDDDDDDLDAEVDLIDYQ